MPNVLACQLTSKLTYASAVDCEAKKVIDYKAIPAQATAEVLQSIVKVW
ncbi:hypothetical protein MicvaDRAFT_3628 [Microcoleus vaginatus FGP-2]|nr:hypothetical protein MicvaDRAFT_3628 [Microcoleus vaginatus FGP-2]